MATCAGLGDCVTGVGFSASFGVLTTETGKRTDRQEFFMEVGGAEICNLVAEFRLKYSSNLKITLSEDRIDSDAFQTKIILKIFELRARNNRSSSIHTHENSNSRTILKFKNDNCISQCTITSWSKILSWEEVPL